MTAIVVTVGMIAVGILVWRVLADQGNAT